MYQTKDSGKRIKFSTGMQRDIQDGKTQFDLLFPKRCKHPMLVRWAELLTRGAVKYNPRNWEKARTKAEFVRFKASAIRHFMQWFMGQEDEDHAAAVYFNIQGAEMVKERLNEKANKA